MKNNSFLSISLSFLLFSQILSQVNNNNQNERITPFHNLNHQIKHPNDYHRVKDNKSNRIINKTVFENEYHLVESLEQYWHKNDSVWVNNIKLTYTYDEGQKLLKMEQKEWDDSVWTNDLQSFYFYDNRNNIIKLEEEYWYNSLWNVRKEILNTYNENNDVIERTYKYGTSNSRQIFNYNSNYLLVENIQLTMRSGSTEWDTVYKTTYNYDQHDLLIKEDYFEAYNSNNGSIVYNKIRDKSYWYDEKYNLTRIYSISYTPIRYYEKLNTTFTYDDYDRVIGKRRIGEYHYHSDSWSEYGYELYSYEKDNLIEKISQGELSDREKILYTYDENNNLIEKLVYDTGWSIEQPELKKREKIQYKYSTILEVKSEVNQSQVYELSNNYPNPFNPIANIDYYVPIKSFITLKVFDVLGNEIKTLVNSSQSVGKYKVEFNGSDLSSGIYFYRLQAGDFVEIKKMILMK